MTMQKISIDPPKQDSKAGANKLKKHSKIEQKFKHVLKGHKVSGNKLEDKSKHDIKIDDSLDACVAPMMAFLPIDSKIIRKETMLDRHKFMDMSKEKPPSIKDENLSLIKAKNLLEKIVTSFNNAEVLNSSSNPKLRGAVNKIEALLKLNKPVVEANIPTLTKAVKHEGPVKLGNKIAIEAVNLAPKQIKALPASKEPMEPKNTALKLNKLLDKTSILDKAPHKAFVFDAKPKPNLANNNERIALGANKSNKHVMGSKPVKDLNQLKITPNTGHHSDKIPIKALPIVKEHSQIIAKRSQVRKDPIMQIRAEPIVNKVKLSSKPIIESNNVVPSSIKIANKSHDMTKNNKIENNKIEHNKIENNNSNAKNIIKQNTDATPIKSVKTAPPSVNKAEGTNDVSINQAKPTQTLKQHVSYEKPDAILPVLDGQLTKMETVNGEKASLTPIEHLTEVKFVNIRSQGNLQHMDIILKPDGLGHVSAKLQLQDNKLIVEVWAENKDTARLLSLNEKMLKDSISNGNLNLSKDVQITILNKYEVGALNESKADNNSAFNGQHKHSQFFQDFSGQQQQHQAGHFEHRFGKGYQSADIGHEKEPAGLLETSELDTNKDNSDYLLTI